MLSGVRSVGVYVADQRRSVDFFRDALGCEVISDQPMGPDDNGPRWIEVRIPGDDTILILFTPEGQESRIGTYSNILFHCEDMQRTYEDLTLRGVEFPDPPTLAPWGKWWATFSDPDGNVYGLTTAD